MNNETHSLTSDLENFNESYRTIHGILAPIICVLGIVANCLNIVVLTRGNMVSPTNVLLASLAISDGLTMASYFPYVILNYHIYTIFSPPLGNAQYLIFFAVFSVVLHSISIWITVSLAVFRYIVVRYPCIGVQLCSLQRAKITVFIVCLVVTIVCIPNSVSLVIVSVPSSVHDNATSWYVDVRDDTSGYRFLKSFNLWVQAVLIKLLPCLLLAILSILLIQQMKDAVRRHKALLNRHPINGLDLSTNSRHGKTNRTTRMLVVVVVLFVVTETPQGILQLLGGVVDGFFDSVYGPLGDIMDTLTLFNNGINFVLYCSMSKQFRDTFMAIFVPDIIRGNPETFLVTTQTTRLSKV